MNKKSLFILKKRYHVYYVQIFEFRTADFEFCKIQTSVLKFCPIIFKRKMNVTVLGGGISGLSAALSIVNRHKDIKVKLFEASGRFGGWIKSEKRKNVIFEAGPRTIRPKGIAGNTTLELIEVLGLQKKIVAISTGHVAAKRRMIYANNQLCLLPNDLKGITKVIPPFTKPLYLSGVKDFFGSRSKQPGNDESIYDFAKRRFGKEIADYAVSSMICGICAGDAKEISVKFLMKNLFEKEQKFGSVIRGIFLDLIVNGSGRSKPQSFKPTILMQKARYEKWSIYSLEGGLEVLPKAIVERLGKNKDSASLQLNSKCQKIKFLAEDQVEFTINGTKHKCNKLISSLPSYHLASLVKDQHPTLATQLNEIKSVDVAVINLHYNSEVLEEQGFGVLVPPIEELPILGIIFDSCCFKIEGQTVLTVMAGGKWFEKWFGKNPSEQKLLNVALEQVERILNISQKPDNFKVNILRNCIPQYTLGHHDRVESIRKYIDESKLPLSVCGASFDGVGVNDVILSAVNAVNQLKLDENEQR